MYQFKSDTTQKPLNWRQPNFVWYEKTCMAIMKTNLGFLETVDWELCLLEVGQFFGQLLAILTTVQWCQVAQRNTRYVPSRYTHHILPHIGHWWPFGNNWLSTISSPSFRSFLGVDLTHLIKTSVPCTLFSESHFDLLHKIVCISSTDRVTLFKRNYHLVRQKNPCCTETLNSRLNR